jgi:hypothetical protein
MWNQSDLLGILKFARELYGTGEQSVGVKLSGAEVFIILNLFLSSTGYISFEQVNRKNMLSTCHIVSYSDRLYKKRY